MFTTTLLSLLLTSAHADKPVEKDVVLGHIGFAKTCSAPEVVQIGETLVAKHPEFTAMAVTEVDNHQYGLYFKISLGRSFKTSDDLRAHFNKTLRAPGKKCTLESMSFSSFVITIK